MTILSVTRDVCFAVGVNPPTSLFATSVQPRTQVELLSLANEMAQRIAFDARDWQVLRRFHTLTGPGGAFPLPTDYRRMLLTMQMRRSTNPRMPMRYIADADEWLVRRMENASDAPYGEWMINGNEILVWPALAGPTDPEVPAETARFVYLENGCIKTTLSMPPETRPYFPFFQTDDDVFRIDERLLKLGMIWQWKANKGSPYAEDMGTYGDAMQVAMGSDKPAPIMVGNQGISAAAQVSGVWPADWGAGGVTMP